MTKPTVEMRSGDGASCTLYRDAPLWDGQRTAAIGAFSCDSAEAGAALLTTETGRLAEEGYEAVIGPMDGDTWHSYRLISKSDKSPPFFLEPVSGAHDLTAFQAANFEPISSYVSARTPVEEAIGEPAPAVDGVTITPWDGRNAEALIGGLFDLSSQAFTDNLFYKPIARAEFLQLYQPILPRIDPRLVLFAHKGERLVGFLFAVPDHLQGENPNTVILKTYASGVRGVGRMLADHAHRAFREYGYRHVIHALMHVDNQSSDRSERHHGKLFRRYDLMGLRISQTP